MKKDPKRVLESLRIEEEDPLLHYRPRKFRKRKNELSQVSNTAILSLCLVTGLSTGVGSAFANNIENQSAGHLPLDEPPNKVQLDSHVVLPQTQVPQTKSSELTPSIPPIDEPATNVSEQQPKHNDNVQTGKSQIKDINNHKKSTNHPHQTKTQQVTTTQQKHTNQKEATKTPSAHHETKQTQEKIKNSTETPVGQDQPISTVNVKKEAKYKENFKPKTVNGGELPHTAGNDLNGAALGAGAALVGALILKRKRAKT